MRTYPDLGWINSKPEELVEECKREQKNANLNTLTICQMNKMSQLNRNYKEKFGFPFVICARKHQKDEIFQAMEHRYNNDQNQGNLLKGIVIWFIRREGIEPIKRVSFLLLFSVTCFL